MIRLVKRARNARLARLALLVPFALMLLSTAATSRQAAHAPIQLTVGGCWSDPIQGGAFIRMAEGFNKVQSAIHINATRGVNQTTVLAGVSAGNPIDVYYDCNDQRPSGMGRQRLCSESGPLHQARAFQRRMRSSPRPGLLLPTMAASTQCRCSKIRSC